MECCRLKSIDLPLLYDADVAVIGGGSAGCAAAVAAAREGARTVLIEKTGALGGINTNGLLPSIIKMSDGKNITAQGLCKELVDAAAQRMNCKPNYLWQNIQPEILKVVYDEMVTDAGVKIYLGIHACSVVVEKGELQAIAVSTPDGLKSITAKVLLMQLGMGIFPPGRGLLLKWEMRKMRRWLRLFVKCRQV